MYLAVASSSAAVLTATALLMGEAKPASQGVRGHGKTDTEARKGLRAGLDSRGARLDLLLGLS